MPTAAGAVMIVEVITFDGATWYGRVFADAPTVAASLAVKPGNPTGTTVTSAPVMMGLGQAGCVYTPLSSVGKVRLTVKAEGSTAMTASTFTVSARYGTGTAPANAAAETGTQFGAINASTLKAQNTASAAVFVADDILTGLTPGTQIWVDLALATGASADEATLVNISCVFEELAA